MAYNKAREEQKWKKWKEREEEKLRELGMDEVSIQVLHESDWADFNSERRYREHQMPLLDYVEMLLAETEVSETQIQSVEELLDAIGDEQLLHILMEADRTTLQIVVLKMMGNIFSKPMIIDIHWLPGFTMMAFPYRQSGIILDTSQRK